MSQTLSIRTPEWCAVGLVIDQNTRDQLGKRGETMTKQRKAELWEKVFHVKAP